MTPKIDTNHLAKAMEKAGLDPTNPRHMEAFAAAYAAAVNHAIDQAATTVKAPAADGASPTTTQQKPAAKPKTAMQQLEDAYKGSQPKPEPTPKQQTDKPKTGHQLLEEAYANPKEK